MPSPGCQYSDEELLDVTFNEAASPALSSHLEHCAACRQRLQQLQKDVSTLTEAMSALATDKSPPRQAEDLPATIGTYYIVGKLGQGVRGNVYRAMHPELNIEVAIKIARQPVAEKERELLIREARLLVSMHHPALVRIRDLDFHEGRPFLVMDFVKGTNLEKYRRQKPLAPLEAAALVARMARAVAVLHGRGMVHQHLKPSNILIDQQGQPHLVDCCLARMSDLGAANSSQPGDDIRAFQAPEQRQPGQAISPQADVFALGGILFWLLTGQAPFGAPSATEVQGPSELGNMAGQLLAQPHLPAALRDICLRALAARPADRYARMDDLAEALERYIRRPQRWRLYLLAAGLAGLLALLLWRLW